MMFAALSLLAALALGDAPKSDESAGRVSVLFMEATVPRDKLIRENLVADAQFQAVVSAVNEVLILPADLRIRFMECKGAQPVNAATDVRVCYEDIAADTPPEPGMTSLERSKEVLHAGLFYFLHAMGRSLTERLHIPVEAPPDAGADEFATMISLLTGDALDASDIAGMAGFALDAATLDPARALLGDEAALTQERADRIACLIYGGDPERYSGLVDPDGLSDEKARGCESKFNEKLLSWSQLLEPHLKQ